MVDLQLLEQKKQQLTKEITQTSAKLQGLKQILQKTDQLIGVFSGKHVQIKNIVYNKQYEKHLICIETECPLKRDCKYHDSAGDFRSEDGVEPNVFILNGNWYCSKKEKNYNVHGKSQF